MSWPWSELGLSGPADLAAVRHAYAEQLKSTHPEEDPEGFQRLNEAYQKARQLARKGAAAPARDFRSEPAPDKAGREETKAPPEERPPRRNEKEHENAPEENGWKRYEAAFDDGAARRAEEREQMAQERRAAFLRRHTPDTPEAAAQLERHWVRIEAAQTMFEVLLDNSASFQEWVDFLHSSIFMIVKGDPDFVAGLESVLQRTADLPEDVRRELVRTFSGMDAGNIPKVWHGIHKILTGTAPQAGVSGRRKPFWKCALFRVIAVLASVFVLLPATVAGVWYVINIPGRQERAAICRYLEEDLGQKVESYWNGDNNYKNLYGLWDEPGIKFMVWPDGQRDTASGKLGYTTNYSNVMLTEALEAFAEEWSCELTLIEEGGCNGVWKAYGTSPGGYLLELPMRGGDEAVAALGTKMAQLEQEVWYQLLPPEYELHFSFRGYDELAWYTYTPDQPFDGPGLLEYYQNEAGPQVCIYLVENSGLAEADFGGAAYRLEPRGAVELVEFRDRTTWFFCVDGVLEETGETVRKYFLNFRKLYSMPAEECYPEMTARDLGGELFDADWTGTGLYITIWKK